MIVYGIYLEDDIKMRLLICDDVAEETKKLKKLIMNYGVQNNIRFDIDCCSNTNEIQSSLIPKAYYYYDIIFLDIYMDGLNGLDFAKSVREHNEEVSIVFFSSSSQHALEAFNVNASQYLVKPVGYDAIENAMDLILRTRKERERTVNIETDNGIIKIKLSDIIYSQTQRNYQIITLADGTKNKLRMTSTALYDKLEPHDGFVRVGASYIVNMSHIVNFTDREMILTDGSRIGVPRRSSPELKKRYIEFYVNAAEEML